jgi:ubiquinone/menaquinone biosynthesis C-methylase UbiE
MTDEMLSIARRNADASGLKNVSFLKGQIESIPLPDASIDVIISNCVINLSGDKSQVLREAFRVLKPGGRFAVSDVVTRGELPSVVRDSMGLWTGCVAGALDSEEFVDKLHAAGFAEASVEPTRVYTEADAHTLLADVGLDADALAPLVEGKVMAAFVRATKPREGVA